MGRGRGRGVCRGRHGGGRGRLVAASLGRCVVDRGQRGSRWRVLLEGTRGDGGASEGGVVVVRGRGGGVVRGHVDLVRQRARARLADALPLHRGYLVQQHRAVLRGGLLPLRRGPPVGGAVVQAGGRPRD